MPVQEGQFKFQSTTFGGLDDQIIIEDADMPEAEFRTNDTPKPLDHGLNAGRDRLGGTTWTFNLATVKALDTATAVAAMAALKAKWYSMLDQSFYTDWLYFCVGGVQYKVRGRPGPFTNSKPSKYAKQGAVQALAQFRLTDPRIYLAESDVTHTMTLTAMDQEEAVAIIEGESSQLMLTGYTINKGAQAVVVNPASADVGYKVTISGPITYPTILVGDHHATLLVELEDGDVLTFNTVDNVIRVNGERINNVMGAFSTLTGTLKPGSNIFLVCGTRNDGTVTATIEFSPANYFL